MNKIEHQTSVVVAVETIEPLPFGVGASAPAHQANSVDDEALALSDDFIR